MSRYEVASRLLEDEPTPSGWGNLGDWSAASSYAAACRALAIRVGKAAGLSDRSSVLDLGFGGGASLSLWATAFGVRRVDGIDVRPHCVRSASGHRGPAPGTLHAGPVLTVLPKLEDSYGALVSVDAAYHFGSLSRLLADAVERLATPGSIALTTLAWPATSGRTTRWLWRCCLAVAAIPASAVVRIDRLVDIAESAGLSNCRVELLDEPVMAGFARFVEHRQALLRPHRRADPGWRKIRATARFCTWATRTRQLHYVLLSAHKTP